MIDSCYFVNRRPSKKVVFHFYSFIGLWSFDVNLTLLYNGIIGLALTFDRDRVTYRSNYMHPVMDIFKILCREISGGYYIKSGNARKYYSR